MPTSTQASAAVHRLNHAVLFVVDAERAKRFYCDVLGFDVAHEIPQRAVFLRARGSSNDHDLGLFALGDQAAPRDPRAVGLYHLAWQVDTIDELAVIERRLREVGSLVGASDHGVSRALYALDPDGNEFEVMWATPRAGWPDTLMGTNPLDLAADLQRFGGVRTLHELTTVG
ncbi:MAG: VOC family protein [Acidimicrobiales bacterium]|nr:VOC family protein [Acidimicrobiales bacterium]